MDRPEDMKPLKSNRKFHNFLLMPNIQLRLGAYMVALALALLLVLVSIVYLQMGEVVDLIVRLTDVEKEVREVLVAYLQNTAWWIILAIIFYIVINIGISILYTHKMVGPVYAFRRHIQLLSRGKFQIKTILRKGDAFEELASDLNQLSDALNEQYGCAEDQAEPSAKSWSDAYKN
ncbi:MAG: hypothetical protein H6618_04135 [Deltaproteobacteria bacterium]|nr:hypothetical protein [Deltaproteobacteria bacterium]